MQEQATIRVLLFDHTAVLGGGELSLVELVKRFDRNRVSATVLLGSHGPLEELLQDHVPVQFLPMNPRVRRMARASVGLARFDGLAALAQSVAYVGRLARLLRVQRFDVIHTNSLKSCILGGVAGRLAGCRVVWHVRDRIEEDYLPRRAVRLMRFAARILPHLVVANSRATLGTLHLNGTASAVVPSGVDLTKFFPSTDEPATDSRKLIGLIGRICPWKGQHIFIEAAKKVHAVCPATTFQIVGAALFGEAGYEVECRELVRKHSLEQAVEFTGFRERVDPVIRSLDILVHASVLGEPFGQVIVQGMASGKPVIATNGGGVPEIIVHGETGVLVEMGNAEAMAAAILSLLHDPETARRIGERGRLHVQQHFNIEQSALKVMDVYETAVAGKRRVG